MVRFAIIGLAFVLSAGPAAASVTPQPLGRLAGFGGDPTALLGVIAALQRRGATVLNIRFASRRGHPAYDALVEMGDVVRSLQLEPNGSELPNGSEFSISQRAPSTTKRQAKREIARAARAEIGLAAAVRAAESDNPGAAAFAAGVAPLHADPVRPATAYRVLLVRPDGHFVTAAVDARTGLTIAAPTATG